LAGEFVQKIVREEMKSGGDYASILVILESIMLGVMLVNHNLFGMSPRKSAMLVEAAGEKALERFLGLEKEGKL